MQGERIRRRFLQLQSQDRQHHPTYLRSSYRLVMDSPSQRQPCMGLKMMPQGRTVPTKSEMMMLSRYCCAQVLPPLPQGQQYRLVMLHQGLQMVEGDGDGR